MSQHLLSLNDVQLAIIDRALTDLETHLAPPTGFDGEQMSGIAPKSAPASYRQAGAQAVLANLDPLRVRMQRLQQLIQYARDTEIVLVNDALNRRLMAHAVSKGPGKRVEAGTLHGEALIEVA